MPFVSQKQRALFWAAKGNRKVAKKKGLNMKAVEEMTAHDEGGKLPTRAKKGKRRA